MIKKLMNIQQELKAPKGQYNDFSKFKYRSCEDILEAVKPLLSKYRCVLTINDTLEQIGDRYYIKATATIYDIESDKTISNSAYAREEETKKGMDASQITGASSSYARKYALNGLFAIDDTKDADTNEYQKQINKENKKENNRDKVIEYCKEKNITSKEIMNTYNLTKNSTDEDYERVYKELVGENNANQ